MLPDPDEQRAVLRRRARKWRCLSLGGGLLLAASFFMPAVEACTRPAVPVLLAADAVRQPAYAWPTYFYFFAAAYLLGLLVAIGAFWRMVRSNHNQHTIRTAIFLLLAFCVPVVLATSVVLTCQDWRAWEGPEPFVTLSRLWEGSGWITVMFVLPILGIVYVGRTRRLVRRRWLAHVFFSSIWCTIWFSTWLATEGLSSVLYGVFCSLAGSLAILIAITGETAVLTGRSYLRALGGLCIGRIGPLEEDRERCEGCGYPLIGLLEPRCPECGRPFTWAQVGREARGVPVHETR